MSRSFRTLSRIVILAAQGVRFVPMSKVNTEG